jgi:hypothetical protein
MEVRGGGPTSFARSLMRHGRAAGEIATRSGLRENLGREPLAQLVEHLTFNQGVLGSIPRRLTTEFRRTFVYF